MNGENNMDPVLETQPTKDVTPKKKGNGKFLLIPILCAVILMIAVFGYYLQGNKKSIFVMATTKLQDHLGYLYQPFQEISTENGMKNYTTTGNAKFSLTSSYFDLLLSGEENLPYKRLIDHINAMEHQILAQYNADQKQTKLQIVSNLNGSPLWDVTVLGTNQKGYLLAKGIYEKYIDLGDVNPFEAMEKSTSIEDANYLYEFVLNAMKDHIKGDYLTKKKAEVTIDGKKKSANKITLVLDQHNGSEIVRNVVKAIKADQKANQIMESIYPEFKDYKPVVKKSEESGDSISFSTYTTMFTKEILQYDVLVDSSNSGGEKVTIRYILGEQEQFQMLENDKLIGSAEVKKNDHGFTMTLKDEQGAKVGSFVVRSSKGKVDATLLLNADGVEIKFVLNLGTKKTGKEILNDQKFSITATQSGMELLRLSIESDMKTTEGADIKMDTAGIKNAIRIGDIDEAQMAEIQTNVMNLLMKLMSI